MVANLAAHPTTDNAVLLGSWYASRNKFACAVDTFQSALKRDPSSAQLHFLTGLALFGGGRETDAIAQLQQAIHIDPKPLKPHEVLAQLYERAGNTSEAEEQWKQVLAIDPASQEALETLSTDLINRQDYPAVVKLLDPAPRSETIALNLSHAYDMLNYPQAASQALIDGLKVTPKSVHLAQELAAIYTRHFRYEDSIKILRKALADHPGDSDVELQLFRTLVLSNHLDEARPIGPKLRALRPHDPDVLGLNSVVERADADYVHARTDIEEAIALRPNDSNFHYNLGIILVYLREFQRAKEELEKSIALGESVPQVHFELSKALRGLGDTEGTNRELQIYQQMRKADEAKVEETAAIRQGDQALSSGDIKEALLQYRLAVERMPDNADYKYKLSVALHQSGDLAGEKEQLEQAVKLNPNLAPAQRQLGYLLDRSGDPDAAIIHFRAAVQAAPAWVDAWINLSAELAATGQFDDARQSVAKALQLDPANPTALKLSDRLNHDPRAQN
jgi:tetratricopeptide (TPR) repeat protein